MSVVAWDGRTLAADRQGTANSKITTCSKIARISTGEVLAWTGDLDRGLMMAKWYEDGADPEKWPDFQGDKDGWCRLIVAFNGGVKVYERHPIGMTFLDPFMAWGAGQDFAVGAMAMGADATKAVEIANMFSDCCGRGVESFDAGYPRKVSSMMELTQVTAFPMGAAQGGATPNRIA